MSTTRRLVAVLTAVLTAAFILVSTTPAQAGTVSGATTGTTAGGGRYALQTITVEGRRLVTRWNPCQSAITYRVNLAGVPKKKRAALLAEIKQGVRKLAAVNGIRYRYAGTTAFVPRKANRAQQPAEIVIAAVARTRTDLGMTGDQYGFGGTSWVDWWGPQGTGAAITRGYVLLNPALFLPLRAGYGAGRTQGNVILHELAHASGAEHVHTTDEQMNPVLTAAAPNGYAAGDRAALRRLGRPAGCITVPAGVSLHDLK